jgi:pyrophosphatase PpaX
VRSRVVLFDLDGTLIDSGAMILASMRHAAETVLERRIPDEELMAAVGGPGLVAQMRSLDPDHAEELVRVYREHNEPLHEELQACVGVLEVLPELTRRGARLGIVTAKRLPAVRLAFDVIPQLERYFDVVVGAEDTERHKPHPDPILEALERLDAEPPDGAYVGDSPFDVQAAKAAGVLAVAVTWGRIHDEERLAREQPDAIVHTAEELLVAVESPTRLRDGLSTDGEK